MFSLLKIIKHQWNQINEKLLKRVIENNYILDALKSCHQRGLKAFP